MDVYELIFYVFSFFLVMNATLVVTVQKSVYKVFFLILTFFNVVPILILAGAEFVAYVFLIVYVGAIAVLFLFVVMMIDSTWERLQKEIKRHKVFSIVLGSIFAAQVITLMCLFKFEMGIHLEQGIFHKKGLEVLSTLLYIQEFESFQMLGFLLLSAMVCVIVIAWHQRKDVKRQNISQQIQRTKENSLVLYEETPPKSEGPL